jgi:hypothetical protein
MLLLFLLNGAEITALKGGSFYWRRESKQLFLEFKTPTLEINIVSLEQCERKGESS